MDMDLENELTNEQIAATIAHEIKNPLALIRATLQYLELGDTQRINKQKYDLIYREIDRLNELIVTYMESAHNVSQDIRKFEAYELIGEIEQMFSVTLKMGKIMFGIVVPDKKLTIKGDYNKIKQVLINLVTNAIEALEDCADRKIDISAYKDGGNVVISVADNGCGIAESHMDSIGTPFFTTKEKGTGLGLSISKEIIKMHNGNLCIKGTEGKGTVVVITIPLLYQ